VCECVSVLEKLREESRRRKKYKELWDVGWGVCNCVSVLEKLIGKSR
jgi:hypothetical protein